MKMTRKQMAEQLWRRACNGPDMTGFHDLNRKQVAEIQSAYRLWASTWVLGHLTSLVPELKDQKFDYATSAKQEETT